MQRKVSKTQLSMADGGRHALVRVLGTTVEGIWPRMEGLGSRIEELEQGVLEEMVSQKGA